MKTRQQDLAVALTSIQVVQDNLLLILEKELKIALLSSKMTFEQKVSIASHLTQLPFSFAAYERLVRKITETDFLDSLRRHAPSLRERFKECVSMAKKLGINCYGLDKQETNARRVLANQERDR